MTTWTARPLLVDRSVELEAELVVPEGAARLVVVLCHGLPSGSPRDPDDPGYPGLARALASQGFAAARFSFSGCYGSGGDLSMPGWVDDLAAVVRAVRTAVTAPVAVVGSSLGGATALIEAAGDPSVGAVATLAAPADLESLTAEDGGAGFIDRVRATGLFRTPGYPPDPVGWARQLLETRPEDAARELGERPLLVLHGGRDDVVPPEHGERIAAAASGPVEHVLLPGAGHQLRRDPDAIRALEEWLGRMARRLS
ncbi:MAG TPA: alpha/beta fold hydrolase [Actinomycetota bacterium]|nr:alpha/beta fold hydrolase [Actinomycetota bacterium]